MPQYTAGSATVVTVVDSGRELGAHFTGAQSKTVALSGGGYVVLYEETGTGNYDGQSGIIFGQLFDATGSKIGAAFYITPADGIQYQFRAASALQDGGFMVSWADPNGAADDIVTTQRFDAAGAAFGATTHDNVLILQLAGGAFVGVTTNAAGTGVNYQLYDSDLQAVGSVNVANTRNEGYRFLDDVKALADGGFCVVWNEYLNNTSSVFEQRFDSSGAKVGGETQVNSQLADFQFNAQVTPLANGGYVVSWLNVIYADYANAKILFQVFDPNGHKVAFNLQANPPGFQGVSADVEALGDGFVVVYHVQTANGNYQSFDYAQRYDAGGVALGQPDLLAPLEHYDVTGLENGSYVLSSWLSPGSDGLFKLYQQMVTGDANPVTGDTLANAIAGTAGADLMHGLSGDDTYVVDHAGDLVYEDLGDGNDTVQASVSYAIGTADIETLILTGTSDINGTGNDLANTIAGNAGNNIIDGRGGADTMIGGAGNDTYYVWESTDAVIEIAGEGYDTVYAEVSYDATGQDIENIQLIYGNPINGTGNGLANTIVGNHANNILSGAGGDDMLGGAEGNDVLDGGAGADTMKGGVGDDTYYVDSAADVVSERADAGTDTVVSTLSWTLGANVENLTLDGSAAINGTGNVLNNVITGNSGANILAGMGGNDTYVFDNAVDKVVEGFNQGTDTVMSSITYTIGGQYIENVVLTGTANIGANGNGLANNLTGNSGNNLLNGNLGNDAMAGGAGNDTYYISDLGDTIVENTGEGVDVVYSFLADYALGANLETLILTGYQPISGSGNGLDNTVTGNDAINRLNGGDGKDVLIGKGGNDILTGGAGVDQFRFAHAGIANGVDHITDFTSGTDKLIFLAADYGIARGHVLTAAELHGGGAVGAGTQFLYNSVNHTLYWDADGAGGTAPIAIAVFDNAAALKATDFTFL